MIYDLANFNLVGENSATTAGLKGIYVKEAIATIPAIKLVRAATGVGLREAKEFVNSITNSENYDPYPDLQYPYLLCYTTESDETIEASLAAEYRDKIEIVPITGTDTTPVPTVDYKNSETLVVRQSSDKAKLPVPYSYVNVKTGAGTGEILLSETTKTFIVPESNYVGWHAFTVTHAPVEAIHTYVQNRFPTTTSIHITPSTGYDAMMGVDLQLNLTQYYDVEDSLTSLAANQSVNFILEPNWSNVNLLGQIPVADNPDIRIDFAMTSFSVEDTDAVEEYTLVKVYDLQEGDYTGRYWVARFSTDSNLNATITLIQEITTPTA